jgi:hypothetical protein
MSTLHNHDAELRSQAIERLKKRSEFWSHLAAYVLINALIVMVWFLTGAGFFWRSSHSPAGGSGCSSTPWTCSVVR